MTTRTTRVMEAVIGGALLGTASGLYMILAGKVAGNSGAVKACVLASTFDRKGTETSRVSSILFFFWISSSWSRDFFCSTLGIRALRHS